MYGQNGSDLLIQQYGTEIWLEQSYYDYIDWEGGLKYLVGSNSNYSTAGVVIANGASTNLYIPMASIWAAARLYVAGLKNDLLFRFTFNPANVNTIAGLTPSVSACSLLLRGAFLPAPVKEHQMTLYRTMKLDFPFLSNVKTSFNQTLNPNTEYKFVLSGIHALVSSMFVTFRSSPVTAATYATYINGAASYDVTSQDGSTSLLGGLIRSGPSADFRNENVLISLEYFDSQYMTSGNNANILYIPWNRSPKLTLMTGASKGFCSFSGFEILRITTPNTLVAGAYQIDVFGRTLETLKVRNGGVITASKS